LPLKLKVNIAASASRESVLQRIGNKLIHDQAAGDARVNVQEDPFDILL
jgi:hypothetical protein